MLPKVTGEFRAATDPTLRFTPSGMAVAEFRVVADKKKKDDNTGQWVDDKVCWLSVVCFKKQAENVAESVVKGTLVTVTGNLQTESYETKDTNEKRQKYVVVADNVGIALTWEPAKTVSTQRSSAPAEDPWSSGGGASSGSSSQGEDPPF
jgi:single-strand DNA-binding protein